MNFFVCRFHWHLHSMSICYACLSRVHGKPWLGSVLCTMAPFNIRNEIWINAFFILDNLCINLSIVRGECYIYYMYVRICKYVYSNMTKMKGKIQYTPYIGHQGIRGGNLSIVENHHLHCVCFYLVNFLKSNSTEFTRNLIMNYEWNLCRMFVQEEKPNWTDDHHVWVRDSREFATDSCPGLFYQFANNQWCYICITSRVWLLCIQLKIK